VKFKTAEGVGPVGEGKSAEAQAVVLLAAVPLAVLPPAPILKENSSEHI
jgi:hypothetical protein